MNVQKQFVFYPHGENSESQDNLTPKDKLIHVAIRIYRNKETMEAYTFYDTHTKDTKAAAVTIKKCVNNLIREKYLNTRREGKRLVYIFNNKKKFEPFSYEFLDRRDLTFPEKSYIVATQQFMFKNENTETGDISYTNKELSKLIKMPESTISKNNRSLEVKGLLEGASLPTKQFKLRELDQLFIWKFKEQDEKIQQNTNKIEALEKDNAELKKRVIELEKLALKDTKENKKLEDFILD